MFTGIVSEQSAILKVKPRDQVLEIWLERPTNFQDIKKGDSISVDGVCLTLEEVDSDTMSFALAKDTLETTGWDEKNLIKKTVNLELSLKLNDFVGGHLVTGHVDGRAKIKQVTRHGENQFMVVEFPEKFKKFLWKKGYVTVNGVSLTIQEMVEKDHFRVGLVPETLKRTNLSQLKVGSFVTFEVCYWARAFVHYFENENNNETNK